MGEGGWINELFSLPLSQLVSHTTEDLKFEWEEDTPLVVDAIQLPQLQLVKNKTSDCTQIYSTG